jgi:hypothetical protein
MVAGSPNGGPHDVTTSYGDCGSDTMLKARLKALVASGELPNNVALYLESISSTMLNSRLTAKSQGGIADEIITMIMSEGRDED